MLTTSHIDALEDEAIHILREVAAEFQKPVLLYSVGKDSTVLLHLAKKAFAPASIPFPLLHVDTGYKFPEMIAFRDEMARQYGVRLIVARNEMAIEAGANPLDLGTDACCAQLKTQPLLEALRKHAFDAAIGGARRDEEKSRAKERIFSFRDQHGQWDPRNQRPELWKLWNSRLKQGESVRVFPLSNWTERDIWQYLRRESLPLVPLYFAKERPLKRVNQQWLPLENHPLHHRLEGEEHWISCRFRTLGCVPCTAAHPSHAANLDEVIAEVQAATTSERGGRLIDQGSDDAMERKKQAGYF
ncbi:MAG: sulfate adenylyltransferase subunit CysD [Acidobacteria bacterium]|nr:sulfate adenylyltransferase subunit CysD [Acidobacteriota bacterium]